MSEKKKKPIFKRWWFIALVAIVVIGAIGSGGEDSEDIVEGENPEVEEIEEIDEEESEPEEIEEEPEEIEEEPEEIEEAEPESEEVDRKSEIEKAVMNRYSDGDYYGTKLDKIRVNDDAGTGEGYILLVDLTFTVSNRENTANNMMEMYSDDLAATLANKGIEDINEIAIFWTDEYNNRNLKYAYEYRDGGFYITDIAGE